VPVPPAAGVDPGVLGALLARHGWTRHGTTARYTRWTPPGRGGPSLLLPRRPPPGAPRWADDADLLAEALAALARDDSPGSREVLLALAAPGDEIRWRRALPGAAPAASWTGAARLRSAARAMLMSAARTQHGGPAGFHGRRHTRPAAALLDRVLIGPTPGGHLLTAYAPLPDGRPAAAVLLGALLAAREAVDFQRATGRMDAFDAAVPLGVCHELTEALIRLVRGTEGADVRIAWAPASGPPPGLPADPEPVEFSPGDLPALQAAADRYLRDEPAVPADLTATVLHLRRPAPRGGGSVRLAVLSGADVDEVRVRLDEDGYRLAALAHLDGAAVRLTGRLESRGGFHRLAAPRGLTRLDLDAAERERLLKLRRAEP
jgi:hypothetical protein